MKDLNQKLPKKNKKKFRKYLTIKKIILNFEI